MSWNYRITALIGLLLISLNSAAHICPYVPLKLIENKVSIGNLSMDFGQADQTSPPQAWQGPVLIIHPDNTACSVDPEVSILEYPFYLYKRYLLLTTYSGSNKIIYFIDTATCKILWRSKAFIGQVSLQKDQIWLGKQKVKLISSCIPD